MNIKEALLELREEALSGGVYDKWRGICFNLNEKHPHKYDSYMFVRENCEDWKHFSGDSSYPIPEDLYLGKWEGVNLEMRISLIDHLLTKV